jgi:hypothetical protein
VQILVDGTDLLVRSIQGSLQGEPDRVPVAAFIERVAQAREAHGEVAAGASVLRARPSGQAAEDQPAMQARPGRSPLRRSPTPTMAEKTPRFVSPITKWTGCSI